MTRGIPEAATRGLNQWPLLIVVAGLAAGLILAWVGHWRIGSVTIGASMLVGAAERAWLPKDVVGLLKVRRKAFDVALMTLAGLAVVGFALAVPSWE